MFSLLEKQNLKTSSGYIREEELKEARGQDVEQAKMCVYDRVNWRRMVRIR